VLLPEQFTTTTSNITTGLGIGCPLPSISLLPDHRLMHHRLIEGNGKDGVAYLDIFYYLASEIMNRNLHP